MVVDKEGGEVFSMAITETFENGAGGAAGSTDIKDEGEGVEGELAVSVGDVLLMGRAAYKVGRVLVGEVESWCVLDACPVVVVRGCTAGVARVMEGWRKVGDELLSTDWLREVVSKEAVEEAFTVECVVLNILITAWARLSPVFVKFVVVVVPFR